MDGRWAAIDAATVDVTTQWAMGLGYNKGAPDEVLIGLFDVPRRHDFSLGFLYRRDVPSRVLDAAIGHPDRIVRFLAAEGGNLTPGAMGPAGRRDAHREGPSHRRRATR